MALVITSRSTCESFTADPGGWAAARGLAKDDAEHLAGMAGDLALLMPSFVTKRERSLRWGAQRTLELLEDLGEEILNDFMDSSAPDDRPGVELAAFVDFVVDRTANLVEELEYGELLADMARFERHRCRCLLGARRSYGEPNLPSQQAAQAFDLGRKLRLTPNASVGHFSWDLRQTRSFSPDALAVFPSDACDLLFFHNGMADGIRILRLSAAAASALGTIAGMGPTGITPAMACAGLAGVVDHEALLGPFLRQGALEWT